MIYDIPWGGMYMDREEKKKSLLVRLKRIEGQVRGIQRMIEKDTPCIDILTQVAAVTAAMKRVGRTAVQSHLEECLERGQKEPGTKRRESYRDLQNVISQYMDWA